mgnify:FL=1
MKNLFTFIVALFMATSVYAQTETVKEWNFSNWTEGDLTENKTIDGLSLYATASKKMAIDGSNKTVDGVKYTQRLKLSGTGNVSNETSLSRVISFEVTEPSDIYIVAAHAGKSTDASRDLVIASYADNNFASLTELQRISYNYGNPISSTVKYTGTKTAKILIYSSNSGINLYHIKVTPATSTSEKVTISDAGFATHASKFAVDYSNRTDGLEAYSVSYNSSSKELTYTKIDGVVQAGKAVILKGKGDYILEASTETATVTETGMETSDGTKTGASNIYCLANKTSNGVGFYQVSSDVTIPANKAYLEINAANSAKYYSIGIGGNTTGIQAIQQNSVKADGIMYSLSGQRVGKDYKGIVICNGKKMIKK